jgi:hypothetical protein
MLRHWLYCTEFLYKHFASGHLDKCLSVIDMAGLSMSDANGEGLEFVRKTVSIANQHYPGTYSKLLYILLIIFHNYIYYAYVIVISFDLTD